jgi:hypothetical protein
MPSVLERRLRRTQLFAAVQLGALATLPFIQPADPLGLRQLVFVAALLLALVAVALLLTPTANRLVGQSADQPARLPGRFLYAGQWALSLATACTAALLVDWGIAALLDPSLA